MIETLGAESSTLVTKNANLKMMALDQQLSGENGQSDLSRAIN